MRLFIAIDLSPDVRDRLAALLDQLRPLAPLRWSPVNNLHITTKFIGEWPDAKLDAMKRALSGVRSAPFPITVRGLGWFPNEKRPHVLWAGIDGGDPLRHLARETDQAVATLGVPLEKRAYSPHLTLARLPETGAFPELRKAIADLGEPDFGSFEANVFHLYLSAGGRYTKLADFALADFSL
jgi:2'-5' RNA ligase